MVLDAELVLALIHGTETRVLEAEKYANDLEQQVKALEEELTKVEIEANEVEDELSALRREFGSDESPLKQAVVDAITTLTRAIENA